MYHKKSLQCMFLIFCLLYKTLLTKKQNKVLNVKACDKPIIFNNLQNKFSTCFKKLYVYRIRITKT